MSLSLISDTRSELLSLARLIIEDPARRHLVYELVPLLAPVPDSLRLFDCLTEAVEEQDAFENNATDWLLARDFPLRSVDVIADSLTNATDGLLALLTAGLEHDEPERVDMSGATRGAER